MANIDFDRFEVHPVSPNTPLYNDEPVEMKPRKRGRRRPRHEHQGEAQTHFEELAKIAELAHEQLVQAHSRYRFCVYQKDDGVFADVVILDEAGQVASLIQREITHEDFLDWIEHIEEEEGLLFDDSI